MTAKKIRVEPGDRYGQLTIIKEIECIGKGRDFLCQCDCGNTKITKLVYLRRGGTRSCGCIKRNNWRGNKNHHFMSDTRIYSIWSDMKARCLNSNYRRFKDYGGRGIKVCEEWMNFESFYNWSKENGYKDNLTIERIDNNGDYTPDNCCWATTSEQGKNKRNTVRITRNGVTKTLREWCKVENVGYNMVYRRLRRGWDIEDALKTKAKTRWYKHAN